MKRLALALLLVSRVAAADAPDAERLYNEGQTAYDDQRYDDAVTAWQKSYQLSKLPALVYNLAQAYRLGGHCEKAVDAYTRFIALDPQSPQRADAEGRLKEIQPCPAAKPQPTPPAPHPQTPPPPPPPPAADNPGHGKRLAGLVLLGAGIVVGAGGPYFGLQARADANDVKAACGGKCEWTAALAQKESAGKQAQTLQYAAYRAGAALVLAGALLYRSGRHASEHAAVTVVPRADGAAVTWFGSW